MSLCDPKNLCFDHPTPRLKMQKIYQINIKKSSKIFAQQIQQTKKRKLVKFFSNTNFYIFNQFDSADSAVLRPNTPIE